MPWLAMAVLAMTAMMVQAAQAADPEKLAAERALLESLQIKPDQLKPLMLDTTLVKGGRGSAIICHADNPAWRDAAAIVQAAIAEATGVTLPMHTDGQISYEQADGQNVILLGHLDNNRLVARLYHNFFVCLDVGYTGREGYVIRSVHDPFGTGHNYILVGGSYPEGTRQGAQAFADLVRDKSRRGELTVGRLLELEFDPTDRYEEPYAPLTEAQRDQAIESGRRLMFSPGEGRNGISRLAGAGVQYHRTGDPLQAEVFRGLILALLEYYATDEYINAEGLARYDRDFRDSWTHRVAIAWDLLEESGVFSDEERLAITNYILRLALECVLYQRWDRSENLESWSRNENIVHNHNTFPALGVYFVGNYLKRHYHVDFVEDWLTVAHGIFNGQKHSSKPLEDAASYQWLPIIHTMVYSLAEGDLTFFDEGHARATAKVALMVMDNAGYQSAFGDHSAYKASSGIGTTLQKIAWYYKDPAILWGARLVAAKPRHPLGQPYCVDFEPRPPAQHVGLTVSYLPRLCYDYAAQSSQYPTPPNLPWEQTFDKLAFRGGLEREDEYMLLDGFGRGTHMHFDANAIIRYAAGGEPLLVDGEYIKNAPKYHSSVVIIRDGQAELTPAVTGLGRADQLDTTSFTRTYLTKYNGAEWTRAIVWRRGDYFLISDEVRALVGGDFTLRCCWRPWGNATLEGGRLTVEHPPMRMVIENADGANCRLETMKLSERLPISRLSQQVSLSMQPGDAYRFINLLHAEPSNKTRELGLRRVGEGLIVVERPEGADVVALGPGTGAIPGLSAEAEMLLLSSDRLVAAGCTLLADERDILRSSTPVSVELTPEAGSGIITASEEAEVKLRLKPGSTLTIGDSQTRSDERGLASFRIAAGRHVLRFDPFEMWAPLRSAASRVANLPAVPAGRGQKRIEAPPLAAAWRHAGFEPPTQILPVVSVASSVEPYGRYGPVDKLFNGRASSSTYSVMWPAGVTAAVTAELGAETIVSAVVLREWHMQPVWDIGARQLELSSDGFERDIRIIEAPFEKTGTQSWGSNVNTLMEIQVGQRARQIRLTISPARDDSHVYLAEVEIHGTRPGVTPDIRAMATGDLTGDGRAEVVVGSDSGAIQALTAAGKLLWDWKSDSRAAINTLACADVDGDGRAEVMYGGDGARLGLLSHEGTELWHARPPDYRGKPSDVMTVLPADVDGDGLPEIICGCTTWQYFAYDARGEMLWRNVIYAHSATVGWADDFDGDGLPEIVGGNAYYRLNLIDDDGKRIFRADRFGPEQTAVSSADVDGDGLPEILVGTDGGEVLCFDGDGKRLWTINVGDKVTRIVPVDLTGDGQPEIVCAAESANVFALRADGSVLWRTPLPDGVGDLAVIEREGGLLVATAGAAGVVVLDAEGKPIAVGATPDRAEAVVVCEGCAVVTTDAGTVHAFDLR